MYSYHLSHLKQVKLRLARGVDNTGICCMEFELTILGDLICIPYLCGYE